MSTKKLVTTHGLLLIAILTGLAITVVLFATTPAGVGPTGITLFFGLVYMLVFSLLEWFYQVVLSRKKAWAFWLRAMYAAAPVVLIALASLRQLTTTDVVVSVALVSSLSIYHGRHST